MRLEVLSFACRTTAACLAVSIAGCSEGPAQVTPAREHADGQGAGAAREGLGELAPPTRAELTRLVTRLASDEFDGRNEGTEGSAKARAFIIGELQRCGVKPAGSVGFEQPLAPHAGTNILGRIEGSAAHLRDRLVLLSAHYDHLGHCDGAICNGAGDNAAAVAQVIAVGCALAQRPPERSVLIAAWDAEEPPAFLTDSMGSEFFAAHPTVPLSSLDVAVVLDLVGLGLWPGATGHFIFGAEFSDGVGASLDAALATVPAQSGFAPGRGGLHLIEETPFGHRTWSDYEAFRKRSIPFLFASDGQNRFYHTPEDETSTLDLGKMELEARLLLDLVARLAGASTSPTYKPDGTSPLADALVTTRTLEAALATGGIVETLRLSGATRAKLQRDLDTSRVVLSTLQRGGTSTSGDVATLRSAVQRVMCLASGAYSEMQCRMI